jgi:uncharacterized protein YrrD
MLYLSSQINNLPVLSIRSGARIGTTQEPIINPHNLHIDGFYCTAIHQNQQLVLLDMNIREFNPRGIVINDHNDLSEPSDLVRLKSVLDLKFKLIDKKVVSNKKSVGKVAEYAVDKESLFIQKLYVSPPVWKNINQSRLIFDRKSVVEVTDTHIVVGGPEETKKAPQKVAVPKFSANYSANNTFTSE